MDQNAIEELFERNADMRLLELRNTDVGKTRPAVKRTGSSFGAESIMANMPDVAIDASPQLRVAIAAAPANGVIPGAVVGVAIDVFNDGGAPAPESKLLLSLPIETQYRDGSLRIDGREPQAPEQLFGSGLPIGRVPGAQSTKVTFQLGVLAGLNALYLQPRLQAVGVPVVGTAGISIKRVTAGGAIAVAGPVEKPFYELEDDEIAEVAAIAGEDPILPPVLPPQSSHPEPVEGPPQSPSPNGSITTASAVTEAAIEADAPAAPAKRAPKAVSQPIEATVTDDAPATPKPPRKRKAAAAPAPAEPVQETVPVIPPAVDERMARYRTIGPNDVALLDRLFSAPLPGVIAHYIMVSTLACNEPERGDDTGGYAAFLKRDIEALGRALVHARMGKATTYRITQAELDALSLPWSVEQPLPNSDARRLRRDLRKPEWSAIGGLLQPSERDATLRTRIALLALAGATFEGVDRRTAEECSAALASYRSSVLAWLVPLCVASANTENLVIPNPQPAVDDAGRRVVAMLRSAFPA